MAIRYSGNTADYNYLASNPLDYNSAYTFAGWVYIAVDRNSQSTFFCITNHDNGAIDDYDALDTTSSGTILRLRTRIANINTQTTGTNLAVGAWHHVAIVRASATDLRMYLNGVQDGGTITASCSGRSAATRMVWGAVQGGNGALANPLNGRVTYFKSWQRALTAAELLNEMRAVRSMHPANLHALWQMVKGGQTARIFDSSGNGRQLSEVNTPLDEDGPPVSWGGPVLVASFVSNTKTGVANDQGYAYDTARATAGTIEGIANDIGLSHDATYAIQSMAGTANSWGYAHDSATVGGGTNKKRGLRAGLQQGLRLGVGR